MTLRLNVRSLPLAAALLVGLSGVSLALDWVFDLVW